MSQINSRLWQLPVTIENFKKNVLKRQTESYGNFQYTYYFREEYEEEQQKALAIASKKHSQLLMSGISKFNNMSKNKTIYFIIHVKITEKNRFVNANIKYIRT